MPQGESPTETEAVDRFEQIGDTMDQEGEGRAQQTGEEGAGTAAAASLLMEQWLQQIEGNPAYLLQRQFSQEEQRLMRQQGVINEPRPW